MSPIQSCATKESALSCRAMCRTRPIRRPAVIFTRAAGTPKTSASTRLLRWSKCSRGILPPAISRTNSIWPVSLPCERRFDSELCKLERLTTDVHPYHPLPARAGRYERETSLFRLLRQVLLEQKRALSAWPRNRLYGTRTRSRRRGRNRADRHGGR